MATNDYYETLGVSRKASADEIRKAYKKLAREYHPDLRPDDKVAEEKFKQVQEAYSVLSDDTKRQKYDQFGHAFGSSGGPGGAQRTWSPGAGGAAFDLNDILGGMFGGGSFGDSGAGDHAGFGNRAGRRQRRPRPGENLRAEIRIPFQVAVEGGQHELQIDGGGRKERLSVRIPPGVNTGSVIRLAGQGHPGQNGGPNGHLLVTVNVAPHPWFRRDGNNVLLDAPITPSEAALGARIEVPTLTEGRIVVTVPPATSSGARLRVKGQGISDPKTGKRGDQIVVIRIRVPSRLSDQERELLERLQALEGQSPRYGLW